MPHCCYPCEGKGRVLTGNWKELKRGIDYIETYLTEEKPDHVRFQASQVGTFLLEGEMYEQCSICKGKGYITYEKISDNSDKPYLKPTTDKKPETLGKVRF